MKKAILSVSNKSGIVEFAKALTNLDYELYSTVVQNVYWKMRISILSPCQS